MFADQTGAMIFFRFLNFAIFIAGAWYVVKKYVIAMIRSKIAQRQSKLKNLAQEYAQIQLKQRSLDQYMMEQEKLTQALISKAHRWKLIVDEYHIRRETERVQLKSDIEKHMALRSENLAVLELQQIVVPRALAKARQELTVNFEKEEQGHAYIGALIQKIESESRG